ncbi:MAG: hypothetical protein K0R18_267 [Bacillales bacterium]|jgi:hypothetical protein|nr:hypothetical protein [Bacillales bacterium]
MAKQPQILETMLNDMEEVRVMLTMFGYEYEIDGMSQELVVENDEKNFLLFIGYNPTNKRDIAKILLCKSGPKKSFDKLKELGGTISKTTGHIFIKFDSYDKMKDFLKTNLLAIIQ